MHPGLIELVDPVLSLPSPEPRQLDAGGAGPAECQDRSPVFGETVVRPSLDTIPPKVEVTVSHSITGRGGVRRTVSTNLDARRTIGRGCESGQPGCFLSLVRIRPILSLEVLAGDFEAQILVDQEGTPE